MPLRRHPAPVGGGGPGPPRRGPGAGAGGRGSISTGPFTARTGRAGEAGPCGRSGPRRRRGGPSPLGAAAGGGPSPPSPRDRPAGPSGRGPPPAREPRRPPDPGPAGPTGWEAGALTSLGGGGGVAGVGLRPVAVGEAGSWRKGLVEQRARPRGPTAAAVAAGAEAYRALVRSAYQLGGVEETLGLLNELAEEEPRLACAQCALHTSLKRRRHLEGLRVLRWAQGAGLAVRTKDYSAVVSGLSQAGKAKGGRQYRQLAFQVWEELLDSGLALDGAALRAGMNATVAVGGIERAERILEEQLAALGMGFDDKAFNILIKGYGFKGMLDKLDAVLERMGRARVAPTADTYNSLVAAYVKGGDLVAALKHLRLMEGAGFAPDVRTFTCIMYGYIAQGDLEGAMKVYFMMTSTGLFPNHVTYTQLIGLFVKRGDKTAAKHLLEEMVARDIRPTVVTYNFILEGQCKQSWDDRAGWIAVMKEMVAAGVFPDTSTYNIIIKAAMANRDVDTAATVAKQMRANGVQPDRVTLTMLIVTYGRLRMVQEAVETFKTLQLEYGTEALDVAAFNSLVLAFAFSGLMPQAEGCLGKMKAVGLAPNLKTFGLLMGGESPSPAPPLLPPSSRP